jgi:hypothetical protein
MMNGVSWRWIAVMATAPFPVAFLVAYPMWRAKETILGSLAGSFVIFATALALILRESVEIERVTRACLDAGTTCWPDPAAFTRYAIYSSIGLVEVFALFMLSLRVEYNLRNQNVAPEWRR